MDPNSTLADLISALTSGDVAEARESFENLTEWIDRGGFLPVDPRSRGIQIGHGNTQHNVF